MGERARRNATIAASAEPAAATRPQHGRRRRRVESVLEEPFRSCRSFEEADQEFAKAFREAFGGPGRRFIGAALFRAQ